MRSLTIQQKKKLNKLDRFFCDKSVVSEHLKGKRVAIVGSGPGSLHNRAGFIDSHDVVVRVNNYKLFPATGFRTDVFYSFFGSSIRKSVEELKRDGVKLCMAKCPNDKFIESRWHTMNRKLGGVDFRYIYDYRRRWWFCPVYVPTTAEFLEHFHLLGKHVPTTGFSGILDVLSYEPESLYITGFDFFQSGIHNVNEKWAKLNPDDPIGHAPLAELDWLITHMGDYRITIDEHLKETIRRQDVLYQKRLKLYPPNIVGNRKLPAP